MYGRTETSKTRADGCICLYESGDTQGTWWLYNLSTHKRVRRDKFSILPMPDVVIIEQHGSETQAQMTDSELSISLDIGEETTDEKDEEQKEVDEV